jgi:VWFA-related protein
MTSKSLLPVLAVISALVVSSLGGKVVGAQATLRASIDHIDDEQFPLVKVFVSLSDAQSQPISGLKADSFTVAEDSVSVKSLEISEIENTEQPLAVALVMDASGSMRSALGNAVEAAQAFVDQLTAQDQIAVIKFAETPAILQPLATDKSAAKAALDELEPEGNYTASYDAIVQAVSILKNYSGRKIIVLVTDGQDSGTGVFKLDQAVQQASDLSIPIYPLGFGGGIDQNELTQIAKLTGGVVQLRPSASDLQASFGTVLKLLRQQYLIEYISSFPADEKQHTVVVTATYQGEQLEDSRLFVARSSQIPVTLPDYEADEVVGGVEWFQPATDWPAPIQRLDITVDGVLLESVESKPFQYEWDSTKTEKDIPTGVHEFKFVMTDIAGNTGQTSVRLDVQPPITVRITQPDDGNTVSGPTSIVVDVTHLSDIQPGKVELVIDGQMVGSPLTAPPYEFPWDLANVPAGKHTVTVTGYDSTGQFTDSHEIIVDVAVGTYTWMIALVLLLAIIGVMIPMAMRARKRMSSAGEPLIKAEQVSLREIQGLNPNQIWPLGVNDVKLGRKRDENDIPLAGRNASRRHAVIRFERGHYVIYSLNVENPVLVNKSPVVQSQVLQPGDEIQLGDTVLKYDQNNI